MDDPDSSLYMFEGKDFANLHHGKQKKNKNGFGLAFIEPPKREHKKSYDVDAYYRNMMRPHPLEIPKPRKRVFKPSVRSAYQFANTKRLWELEEKLFKAKEAWRIAKAKERNTIRQERFEEKMVEREEMREKRKLANANRNGSYY